MTPEDLIRAWVEAQQACNTAALSGPRDGDDGYEEWMATVFRPLYSRRMQIENQMRAYAQKEAA